MSAPELADLLAALEAKARELDAEAERMRRPPRVHGGNAQECARREREARAAGVRDAVAVVRRAWRRADGTTVVLP